MLKWMTWVRCRDQLGASIFLELFEGGALEFKKILRMSFGQLIESNNLVAGQYPKTPHFWEEGCMFQIHFNQLFNHKKVISLHTSLRNLLYLQSYKSYKEDLGYNVITILYITSFYYPYFAKRLLQQLSTIFSLALADAIIFIWPVQGVLWL